MSSLFLFVIRELYLDTEQPVQLSDMRFEDFDLDEAEDDERKLQNNIAFVFSRVLNYASSLVRCVGISFLSNYQKRLVQYA